MIRVDDVTNGGGVSGGSDGNNNDGESSEISANQKLMEMGVRNPEELTMPLPNVSRKALEERERRALRLAEESFSHINQKVSKGASHY